MKLLCRGVSSRLPLSHARMVCAVAVIATAHAAPLFAQRKAGDAGNVVTTRRFMHESWRAADGAPSEVNDIAQTADGYLWLNAAQDIVRFDGVRFVTAVRADSMVERGKPPWFNTPLLQYIDAAGRMALSFAGGDLILYNDGRFTRFHADSTRSDGPFHATPRPDGGMWTIFRDEVYTGKDAHYAKAMIRGAPPRGVSSLASDAAGTLYIGYRDGSVYRATNGDATKLPIAEIAGEFIERLFPVAGGALWISTNRSLVLWQDDHAHDVSPVDTTAVYYAFALDGNGGIWTSAGTHGLLHLDARGGVIETIASTELVSAQVRALCVDHEGTLWVGTAQGLERFRRVPFVSYKVPGGVAESHVAGIVWDDSAAFWTVGIDGNVRRVTLTPQANSLTVPTELNSHVLSSTVRYSSVTALARSTNNSVWIASLDHVDHWSPTAQRTTRVPGTDGSGGVYSVLETRAGVLWAITKRGLYRREGGVFRRFVARNATHVPIAPYWSYGKLFEDREGRVWVGSGALICIEGDSMVRFTTEDGLSGRPARAMYEDTTGTIWFAAGAGALTRFRSGKLTPVSLGANNAQTNVIALSGDKLGNIWFMSDAGVQRVALSNLNDVADGRIKQLALTTFTEMDGLPSQSASGDEHAAHLAPDGTVWFAFDRALGAIDPARIPVNTLAPPTRVEEVTVDEHAMSLDSVTHGLPPGSYRVEFRFTGNSLLLPARMRFRYMLEGADKKWREVGGLQRSATYTGLEPRAYTFRVQSANNDGVWNTNAATLTFRVLPAWYQTWYARGGALLLFAGMAAGAAWTVAKAQRNKREARLHATMEERSRLAGEMHDTLLQGFTGITLQLQGLKIQSRSAPDLFDSGMERLLEIADDTLRSARRAVWALRAPDLERESLAEGLGTALRRATGDWPGLQYQVHGTQQLVSPEIETAVLRIAVEAAVNAVRHAHPNSVRVEVNFTAADVRVCILDDGCGFELERVLATPGSHFGIAGINERAQRVGAHVTIQSAPGEGTRVSVVAPYTPLR